MRSMRWACVLVALIFTAVVDAGQIYGTIVSDGKGVASASIEIKCGTAESVTGSTAADGAYRINVAPQGQCTLTLPTYMGRPVDGDLFQPESSALQLRPGEARRRQVRAASTVSTNEGDVPIPTPPPAPEGRHSWLIDLVKVLALPLVTLVLGYWFNSSLNERQQIDNNVRLYAEMMGRREEADSNLRKDMFNSILNTFMAKDPNLKITPEEQIRQQILSLELLAFNFHESLDIAPLFKEVNRRIPPDDSPAGKELRGRLESVALQVIEHQLTALSDVGSVERGDALPDKIKDSRHTSCSVRARSPIRRWQARRGRVSASACQRKPTAAAPLSAVRARVDWLQRRRLHEVQVRLYARSR